MLKVTKKFKQESNNTCVYNVSLPAMWEETGGRGGRTRMEGKFSGKAQDGSHQYTEMAASQVWRVGSIGLTGAWMCGRISGMIQRCSSLL